MPDAPDATRSPHAAALPAAAPATDAAASAAPSRAYERWVLLLVAVVMLFSTVDRYVVSILAEDIKRDLGLDDRELGWILGPSFTIVYALSILPLARWADVGVRRNVVALGLAFWSLFTTLTAWVQGFAQLFVLRMGVGIGEASASPALQSLISDSVPPEQRSRGLSVISIGAVLGLAVGMAGGGWISEIWGWRTAFVVAGAPGLLVALLFRATVREPVRGAIEGRAGAPGRRGTLLQDCRYLVSLPSMRWLLVAHVFALLYSIGKHSWEPTFLRRVYDMGAGASGTWYFFTAPLPSAFGLFLGGWLCDRWSRSDARAHLWVPALGMLGSIPFLLAFMLWPADHRLELGPGLPRLPVGFLFSIPGSLLGAMYSAPFLAAVQGLARLRMRASAAALFSLTGSGIGSGLGPLLVGELNVLLAPVHGEEAVRWALVWILISLVVASLLCALAARTFRADLAAAKAE